MRKKRRFFKKEYYSSCFFNIFAPKMAKQTLVFESAKELSLNNGMLAITDKDSGEITLRSLEDVQMIMIDNHSVRMSIPLIVKLVKNNISIVYSEIPTKAMMMSASTCVAHIFKKVGGKFGGFVKSAYLCTRIRQKGRCQAKVFGI